MSEQDTRQELGMAIMNKIRDAIADMPNPKFTSIETTDGPISHNRSVQIQTNLGFIRLHIYELDKA